MGVTIQFESHRHELAHVLRWERDPRVVAFVDQPEPLKMCRPDRAGVMRAFWATPDFFVVGDEFNGWTEVKPDERLRVLAARQPNHYVLGPDGRWTCPPGEEAARARGAGLGFRVLTEADIDRRSVRNAEFLEDYHRGEPLRMPPAVRESVAALLGREPGLRLADLLRREPRCSPDLFYGAVASGLLHVDLSGPFLGDHDLVRVYPDEACARALETLTPVDPGNLRPVVLEAGAMLRWGEEVHRVVNVSAGAVTLLSQRAGAGGDEGLLDVPRAALENRVRAGEIVGCTAPGGVAGGIPPRDGVLSRLMSAGAGARAAALSRVRVLDDGVSAPVTGRTLRTWRRRRRVAEEVDGCGLAGLLPRHDLRGNRSPRLPVSAAAALADFVARDFESLRNEKVASAYRQYAARCRDADVPACSHVTFRAAVKARAGAAQTRSRLGPRAAYAEEASVPPELDYGSRHGDYPWHIGHVDHTEADVELVCPVNGTRLGRPWLSLLMLAHSRRVAALHLTFERPSAATLLALLRTCVRRHGRLPAVLVQDNGAEFGSVDYDLLLARFEVVKKMRPRRSPRHGSVLERLFRTTTDTLLHGLVGNTQIMRRVRQVTRGVEPSRQACWTLPALYLALAEWAYEVYDQELHGALGGASPRRHHQAGELAAGARAHRCIPYTEDFVVATLPSVARRTARVQRQGVFVHGIPYWNEALRQRQGRDVPARWDPWDASTAYAQVEGVWHRCRSDHHRVFEGRSAAEIEYASALIRRGLGVAARGRSVPGARLAEFLLTVRDAEVDLIRARAASDAEARRIAAGGAESLAAPRSSVGSPSPAAAPSEADAESPSAPTPLREAISAPRRRLAEL